MGDFLDCCIATAKNMSPEEALLIHCEAHNLTIVDVLKKIAKENAELRKENERLRHKERTDEMGKSMQDILKSLHKKDPANRVEFSCINNNKVLCWVCCKDGKNIMASCESGKTHEEALEKTVDNLTEVTND